MKLARTPPGAEVRLLLVGVLVLATGPMAAASDGIVKLQTADPACPDDSGSIYVDCGNGTVTDNRTGLVWLQDADCIGQVPWAEAMRFVAGLADAPSGAPGDDADCGLSDNSSPGEWRLPAVDEWEAMIADADGGAGELECTPPITNDDGTACWSESCHMSGFCSFTKISVSPFSFYSGASSSTSDPALSWDLESGFGNVNVVADPKFQLDRVWPVRKTQ